MWESGGPPRWSGEHPHHWTDPDNKDLRGLQQCQRLAPPAPPIPAQSLRSRTGNLVDTVETDKNGVASSPLHWAAENRGVKAADFYGLDKTSPIEVEIEFAGQIVKGGYDQQEPQHQCKHPKTGYVEVMPGQQIRSISAASATTPPPALPHSSGGIPARPGGAAGSDCHWHPQRAAAL